ncbi:transferase [Xylariales sp. PMI_506]|nr:transferase [Xylariales sp. PMI_506]
MVLKHARPSKHYHVQPKDDGQLPDGASFPLSAIDYTAPPVINDWILFFAEPAQDSEYVIGALKRGLELTLEQSRWLAGSFKPDGQGGWLISADKGSSINFVVDYLNGPDSGFPSLEQIKNKNFCLLEPELKEAVSIKGMEGGTVAQLTANLDVFAVKVTFIPGGFVLNLHTHHAAVDAKGLATVLHLWAKNTRTIANDKQTSGDCFNLADIDRTVFLDHEDVSLEKETKDSSEELYGVGSQTNQDRKVLRQLLFSLSRDKAAEMKALAREHEADNLNISTYDAFAAMWWHLIVSHRMRLYNADPTAAAYFAQAVDMRKRLSGQLSVPITYQGNCWTIGVTNNIPKSDQLNLGQIASESPLGEIATFVRKVTASTDQTNVQKTIEVITKAQNKASAGVNVAAAPPTAFLITDWRNMDVCSVNFGFGKPLAFRGLLNSAWGPSVIVYESRKIDLENEGIEFDVLVEEELVETFLQDEEVKKWFEFKGLRI